MNLRQRLLELVGHEIAINTSILSEGSIKDFWVLEEVGDDYVVIKPNDSPEYRAKYPPDDRTDGQRFVKIKEIMPIFHIGDCMACSAKVVA